MSRVFSRPLAGTFHVSTTEITSVAGSLLQPTTSEENCSHNMQWKTAVKNEIFLRLCGKILAIVNSIFLN